MCVYSVYACGYVHIRIRSRVYLSIMFCCILSLHVFGIDLPVAAVCRSVCCSVLQCVLQSAAVHIEVVVHFDSVQAVATPHCVQSYGSSPPCTSPHCVQGGEEPLRHPVHSEE